MAGWYVDADKYPISSWFLGCMESEINDHVKSERKRIIKQLQNYFELTCEPNENGVVDENPEWDRGFQAAIALIKGKEE